ncbi:MAG: hypothetical protein CVT49_09150 [candidate division Zixibacteria bacterium HGW-Zixibacteria-1]|nr:MAG: hypothetical protein CVT49_09150 [candidate division Zixibacteria bacterium HGW-Zixibacteria-1]
MDKLAYTVKSKKPFDEISILIGKAVPEHKFRVLAVHNVQETLAEKGFEIGPMKIFEVCNAAFAYKAIKSDVNVAMFMPCKIVVREEKGGTVMTLVRPSMIAEMLPDSGLDDLAIDVEKQLSGIIDEIK